METVVYIEIPVPITFSIDPGQTQTDEPGYPAQVEDIMWDQRKAIIEIDKAIYGKDSTINEDLMAHAESERRHYDEDQADYKYQEMKERGDI